MKKISIKTNLSEIYTSHCIRATTSNVLVHSSYNQNDIIAVTSHKDPRSLLPYVRCTSNRLRTDMSNILYEFSSGTEAPAETNKYDDWRPNFNAIPGAFFVGCHISGGTISININSKRTPRYYELFQVYL